jgi:hypothetical protein
MKNAQVPANQEDPKITKLFLPFREFRGVRRSKPRKPLISTIVLVSSTPFSGAKKS